jgi:tetratricopeptide (TPR) repeat protein
MKQITVNILTILGLLLPITNFAQNKNTELANNYFNSGQYQVAITHYQKAFKKNRLWRKADKYEYFHLLFQISESKRILNDTTYKIDYQNIIAKHSEIEWPNYLKLDKRVYLFIAESEKNLDNFRIAESYYKQASRGIDTMPDFFKLGYAFCSLKQNRFGQALILLNEIEDSRKLEPEFSQYLTLCEEELANSLTKNIETKDTLNFTMNYSGCFGGTSYKFSVIKRPMKYEVVSYKSKKVYEEKPWEIDSITLVDYSTIKKIINFENELKNYNQYKNTVTCTAKSDFLITTKNDSLKIEINDCGIGVGYKIQKLLNLK